jgi:hypothetical protein
MNQVAPKDDIALRIERAQLEATKRRQKRWWFTGLMLLVTGGGIYGGYHVLTRPQAPSAPAKAREATISAEKPIPLENCLLTKAVVTTNNDRFAVRLYDFDANRFLKGKELLADPSGLQRIFWAEQKEHAKEFADAWIVIFAGASFESDASFNLNLCRQRVNAVANLMVQETGIIGQGYWAIRAGEFKAEGIAEADEEVAEERRAAELGERKLAEQRRLIVIVILPPQSRTPQEAQTQLSSVVKTLSDHRLLPTNYDYGQTEPAPIEIMRR